MAVCVAVAPPDVLGPRVFLARCRKNPTFRHPGGRLDRWHVEPSDGWRVSISDSIGVATCTNGRHEDPNDLPDMSRPCMGSVLTSWCGDSLRTVRVRSHGSQGVNATQATPIS